MNTVQLLSQALDAARRAGYLVREEALDGAGGGHCLIRGKKCLLLDLTQPRREQLKDVLDALRAEPNLSAIQMAPSLANALQSPPLKRAA